MGLVGWGTRGTPRGPTANSRRSSGTSTPPGSRPPPALWSACAALGPVPSDAGAALEGLGLPCSGPGTALDAPLQSGAKWAWRAQNCFPGSGGARHCPLSDTRWQREAGACACGGGTVCGGSWLCCEGGAVVGTQAPHVVAVLGFTLPQAGHAWRPQKFPPEVARRVHCP